MPPLAGLRRVEVPELPSFSVEKPESATVLPVELPSGDFRSLRSRGMDPVFGLDTFHEDGMSSDRSRSCSSRPAFACKGVRLREEAGKDAGEASRWGRMWGRRKWMCKR